MDVGACAKDAVEAAGDDHRAHFGMLEAQPHDGVGQFDIHAQIVGIELELVTRDNGRFFVDGERQRGQRRLNGDAPVAVVGWMCLECEPSGAAWPHIFSLYGGWGGAMLARPGP